MGDARHPGGDGRVVRAPTPEMGTGTYVVDWRVVSADGHPVRGAFVFHGSAFSYLREGPSIANG